MAAQETNNNRIPRGVISQEESERSKLFIKTLQDIMNVLDVIQQQLTDEQYLNICNDLYKLKKINDVNQGREGLINNLRQQIFRNQIVASHARRANMRVKQATVELTELQKLQKKDKNGKFEYMRCSICDRLVKSSYMDEHKNSNICRQIDTTKKISVTANSTDVSNERALIDRINVVKHKKKLKKRILAIVEESKGQD